MAAGMPSSAAIALHEAPEVRRISIQDRIRARRAGGNRRRRPLGSRAMSRRNSRWSSSFMDHGGSTSHSSGQDRAPRGHTQESAARAREPPELPAEQLEGAAERPQLPLGAALAVWRFRSPHRTDQAEVGVVHRHATAGPPVGCMRRHPLKHRQQDGGRLDSGADDSMPLLSIWLQVAKPGLIWLLHLQSQGNQIVINAKRLQYCDVQCELKVTDNAYRLAKGWWRGGWVTMNYCVSREHHVVCECLPLAKGIS